VNIAIKNLQKKVAIDSRVLRAIKKAIRKTWELEAGKYHAGEITVCLVNNRYIRNLNLKYRGEDNPTDVIAFNLGGEDKKSSDPVIADIIISTETAISNSRLFKTSAIYELLLYVVHGLLHILGYKDKNPRQQKIMQDKAEKILKFWKEP
jgi:probable rRNA maturation factor